MICANSPAFDDVRSHSSQNICGEDNRQRGTQFDKYLILQWWTRQDSNRNQTVMSGSANYSIVDFLQLLGAINCIRSRSDRSFLVRNWCGGRVDPNEGQLAQPALKRSSACCANDLRKIVAQPKRPAITAAARP